MVQDLNDGLLDNYKKVVEFHLHRDQKLKQLNVKFEESIQENFNIETAFGRTNSAEKSANGRNHNSILKTQTQPAYNLMPQRIFDDLILQKKLTLETYCAEEIYPGSIDPIVIQVK